MTFQKVDDPSYISFNASFYAFSGGAARLVPVAHHRCTDEDADKFFPRNEFQYNYPLSDMWCLDLEGEKLYGGEGILNEDGAMNTLYISLGECDPTKLGPGEECKTSEEREAYLKNFPGLSIPFYSNIQTFNEAEFEGSPIMSQRDYSYHKVSQKNP